jgi:isoamylase
MAIQAPRPAFPVIPASPYPLGSSLTQGGARFAVYAQYAYAVFVALFDADKVEPIAIIPLPGRTGPIWHGEIEGLKAGQRYALRVDGPWDPRQGHRFNPYKYLIDPYAKALAGAFSTESHLHLAYDPDHPEQADRDLMPDRRSNAKVLPKSVLVGNSVIGEPVVGSPDFDWQGVGKPNLRMSDWILYEAHVKGFTAHASSRVDARIAGTYLGFIEKIPYLKNLGINAIEFLPVQAKYPEDHLTQRGLVNHWGYNTAAFFCLEPAYASARDPLAPLHEFKTLVRELHRASIEVIIDVVYNHTAEGSQFGPTLSFRGLDNALYYALESGETHQHGQTGDPGDRRGYRNVTGCGNTLNFGSPVVMRLALDSLRYLATECHVDGFRFDLATVLGRQSPLPGMPYFGAQGDFSPLAPFFQAIAQDPVLAQVKLIAEPWDVATYAVGGFPAGWGEWNGRFRDTVRRFVKGDAGQATDLVRRLLGSPDLYAARGLAAESSVNFVTCHDGFTLWDLVSYDRKHNEANGEENRDGSDYNDSWNCGHEGETDDVGILSLRQRQARNLMTLLMLAQGVPMLNAGDEFLRTQMGNNNPYCQDNPLGWVQWPGSVIDQAMADADPADAAVQMFRFTRDLIALRKSLGEALFDASKVIDQLGDLGDTRHFTMVLDGFSPSPDKGYGRLGLCLNAESRGILLTLPEPQSGREWHVLVQTAAQDNKACLSLETALPLGDGLNVPVPARSVVLAVEKHLAF